MDFEERMNRSALAEKVQGSTVQPTALAGASTSRLFLRVAWWRDVQFIITIYRYQFTTLLRSNLFEDGKIIKG